VGHPEGSVGAVDRYLGLLAATMGRLDDAERHLSAAVEVNEGMGARPWTAHSQHDLAEVLRRRDGPGDRERAGELDRAARATAIELGMALAERIASETETETEPQTDADRQREPVTSGVSATPVTGSPVASATFRREGEYWTIEFGDEALRVRDSKGMRHVARLLRVPGQEIHALDLASQEAPALAQGTNRDRAAAAEIGMSGDGLGDAGPTLDAEAKAAYRTRLAEIREELAEAEAWHDPERMVRLQADELALAHELAGAVGLGGRDRPTASAAERARVSVTRAIRAAMSRIAEQSKPLGDHLEATIRTGTFCSYVPDPRAPITWRL
jgi:hypothetical protein